MDLGKYINMIEKVSISSNLVVLYVRERTYVCDASNKNL